MQITLDSFSILPVTYRQSVYYVAMQRALANLRCKVNIVQGKPVEIGTYLTHISNDFWDPDHVDCRDPGQLGPFEGPGF